MALDVDGRLKSRQEAVEGQVNTILGIKVSTLGQETESLLVDEHLKLTFKQIPNLQMD